MNGRILGSLIGAVGGLVFVLVNSAELPAATLLRVVGIVAGIALLVATVLAIRRGSAATDTPPEASAIRIYWICVAGEVAAIPAGAAVLRSLDHPELTRVWVVMVLGVHFVPFARAFGAPLFAWLGGALMALALVGGALSLAGANQAEPWTAVLAGFTLLGFSLVGALAGTPPGSSIQRQEHDVQADVPL